jgi:hypothetical protein
MCILACLVIKQCLQVCVADVRNAFLYATNKEKTKIITGLEFGALEGQTLIIRGGWYGHNTAAAGFHAHLSATLRCMGFCPSQTQMDLWYQDKLLGLILLWSMWI